MESTSAAMKIHISQTTRSFLSNEYRVSERGEIEVKGKGSMKTYWLDFREPRAAINQSLEHVGENHVSPVKAMEFNYDRRMSMPQYMLHNKADSTVEERRVYSPVTFEDVAKRSVINSPVRNLFSGRGRTSRSNSTGHAYLQSPSDVFGDLIVDTEEFLEDLHHRNSTAASLYSPLSSPAYSHNSNYRIPTPRQKKLLSSEVRLSAKRMNCREETFHFIFPQLNEEESPQKPSPSAPPANEKSLEKRNTKTNLNNPKFTDEADSQQKALQNLDQMVKNIYDTDLPGMCFLPPPNSRSDGYLSGACK